MNYSPAERKLVQTILAAASFGTEQQFPSVGADEWPELLKAADVHGMLPLLYQAVAKREKPEDIPPHVRAALSDGYWRSTCANRLTLEALGHEFGCFEKEGIPVVVLKGGALATWLYPTEGSRSFTDVDILVRPSDKARVEVLLVENGWARAAEVADFREPFLGQVSFQKQVPLPIQLEVHWHILDLPYYNQRIPMKWFWERTQALQIEGGRVLMFAPTAQLLHLCAHLAIHHREPRLMWSYDLALLLARQPAQINWSDLAEAIRSFRLTKAVQSSLALVQDTWGVTLPPEGQARLSRLKPSLEERVSDKAMAARQVAAGPLWDGLFGPSLRTGGYWRQALFPSQAYMRSRYNVSSLAALSLLYLWRIVAGVFKFAHSMVCVLVRSRDPI